MQDAHELIPFIVDPEADFAFKWGRQKTDANRTRRREGRRHGRCGRFLDVWLDESCAWIFPRLMAAQARLQTLVRRHARNVSVQQERSLRQLVRELLLAQASDWPFLIRNRTAAEYATKRVIDHLQRFDRLARSLECDREDGDFLAQCEAQDNLFPHVDWRRFL